MSANASPNPGVLGPAFCARFRGVCAECPENRRSALESSPASQVVASLPPFADLAIAALARCVKLTRRECDVLTLCCSGLKNLSIAHSLGVSTSAVRRHLRNLHEKTNTSDKSELILNLWHASRMCVEMKRVHQGTSSRRSNRRRASAVR
ncbi:MAG: helix-turn-helix domain-containing protein [Planctomycetes bacterium]|nr:helix-turn-helix domain-containing protein [Planctomycetota bacterium]